jgi:hypothetical protein
MATEGSDNAGGERNIGSYELAIVGGGIAALASIVFSSNLMGQHYVKYWTRPAQQWNVLKIIFLAPLFALSAFVGLLELDHDLEQCAHALDMVKECYEAVAIHAFLMLMYDLCGLSSIHLSGKAPIPDNIKGRDLHIPFPLSLVIDHAHLDLIWINRLQRWTMQFVLVRPILSFIDLIFIDWYPVPFDTVLSVLITIGLNISMSMAFMALMTFYHAFETELAPFRPLAKFACIKGVVFFATWQGILLKILAHPRVALLHDGYRFSVDEVGAAWHDFLVCLEMGILFSPLHAYAFPPKDYAISSSSSSGSGGGADKEQMKTKKES